MTKICKVCNCVKHEPARVLRNAKRRAERMFGPFWAVFDSPRMKEVGTFNTKNYLEGFTSYGKGRTWDLAFSRANKKLMRKTKQ